MTTAHTQGTLAWLLSSRHKLHAHATYIVNIMQPHPMGCNLHTRSLSLLQWAALVPVTQHSAQASGKSLPPLIVRCTCFAMLRFALALFNAVTASVQRSLSHYCSLLAPASCCVGLFTTDTAAAALQEGAKHGVGRYTWNSGASYQGASRASIVSVVQEAAGSAWPKPKPQKSSDASGYI